MDELLGEKINSDSRVIEAKRLIGETLREFTGQIRCPQPARKNENVSKTYDQLLSTMAECRGSHLYYPYLSSGIGRGPLVELADGSIKYDFITGIGVHYFGHSHPDIVSAAVDAALEDTLMQGNLQQSHKTATLLESLLRLARSGGAPLKHVFLTSSGAMANENALKMIFQKNHPAKRILAFEKCFAGRTMAAAQITDKPANREGLPKVMDVDYIPFFDSRRPKESTKEAVDRLNEYLKRYPGEYAGMIFELIQGEGGYYAGEHDFFFSLMDILKARGIAIMVDEIQTLGRTIKPFAFQTFGLDRYVDVVTIGKMSQVCATYFTEGYKPKPGLISQTFTASTSAIYAACVTLDMFEKGNLFGENGKINIIYKQFTGHFKRIEKKYPGCLRGPYGQGAMIGCTVFDGALDTTKIFLKNLFDNGLIGFIAGGTPARVRFLPPVVAVSVEDIDHAAGIFEKTLSDFKNKPSEELSK